MWIAIVENVDFADIENENFANVENMDFAGLENLDFAHVGHVNVTNVENVDFAGVENAEVWHQLLEATDESEFSLHQWVDSLSIVIAWLDSRGLELAMKEQISYVCCAGEAAGAGANLTHLPSLVTEMLETYGCERATRINSE